jgi:RHS repeat-associated protein
MSGVNSGLRAAAVLTIAAGGWLACSSNQPPDIPKEVVATTHEALDPNWTPGSLVPVAWYTASGGHVIVDPTDGVSVTKWPDIQNGHDAVPDAYTRPTFNPNGWAPNEGSLHFTGAQLLHVNTWSDTPAGVSTPLTVLAVIKSAATTDGDLRQVVAWWDPNSGSSAWAGIKGADGRTVADFGRLYSVSQFEEQTFNSPHDLGTSAHAIAWQYLAASQTMKLTVDGAAMTSSGMPALDPMPSMPLLIGAGTTLPTQLFQGDIAELVVVNTLVQDSDIANFMDYARSKWDGIPAQGSNDPCVNASGTPISTTATKIRCDDNDATTYGDFCNNGACAGTVPAPGSPAGLKPLAWFHAGSAEVTRREVGGIDHWFDRSTHHHDLSNGFYFTRPTLATTNWKPDTGPDSWKNDKPLAFVGHNLMFRYAWTDIPDGADSEFSVLAVLQPSGSQSTGVAAWWSLVGAGRIGGDLKVNGSSTVLDFFRTDPANSTQDFLGQTDVSSGKHVFAWRYSPGRMQLTVDGVTAPPRTGLSTIGALNPEVFIVGADSGFANTFLNANVAEVSVIPRSITDAELANFDSYAQTEWGGLTLCSTNCSGKACGSDNGCGGTCDCSPCTTSADCPIGYGCATGSGSGICGSTAGGAGTTCTNDAGCANGLHCPNGTCTGGGVGATCGVCAAGLTCENGTCADCQAPCATTGCAAPDACGGTCPCGTKNPGDPCVADADCANGVACAGGKCGGPGATCGECEPGYTCTNGTCQCTPSCDGKTCGDGDGCGGTCQCSAGTTGCTLDSDCVDGSICILNTCMLPECLRAPQLLGCGTPGAVCGPSCTPHPLCTTDSDCPAGYSCPDNNGWRYGVAGQSVCQRQPDCDTIPETLGCGDFFSECGLCDHPPQCQNKQCGDADLSDGVGGRCFGVCQIGQSGCTRDSDCAGGVCRTGVCRPSNPCANILVQPPNCGSDSSLCGPCLNPPPASTDRQCGIDPATQVDAGPCPIGERCTVAGQCVAGRELPTVLMPQQGTIRTITPAPSPASVPIGATPGTFEVSDRGTAVYTIPIVVPPGGPVTPALSLRYSSSAGNGALGVGWSLDGLSQIARCPQTFAQDGYAQPILGTDDDPLCLDGQRLRLVNGPDGPEYRTTIETFTRVLPVYDQGQSYPSSFVAYSKSGNKLTYGATGLSTLANGQTGAWSLTRVEDRWHNFMTIDYNNFHPADENGVISTSEILPAAITYGGYGTVQGDRMVEFMYDFGRDDQMSGWRAPAGTLASRVYLLKGIQISAANGLVRSYQLGHTLARGTNRLTSVQECSPTVCKPATTFDYYDDYGFEDPVKVFTNCARVGDSGGCNGPDAEILKGLSPYGFAIPSGGHDHLATGTVLTTVDTGLVSFFQAVSLGFSIITLGGPEWLSSMASMGSSAQSMLAVENDQFVPLDLEVGVGSGNQGVASYGVVGASPPCAMPARQPRIDEPLSADPSATMVDVCPPKLPTGVIAKPNVSPNNRGQGFYETPQKAIVTPRVWYLDLDGDGLQDLLQCASNTNQNDQTHLTVVRATQSGGSVQIPSPGDAGAPIPAFSDMCAITCNNTTEPTCQAFQAFTTLLDVNGDGTNDLVAADSQDHLAVLLFDKSGNATWHDEYFSGLTISANKRDYVVTMDVNGDGFRDLVALPDPRVDKTRTVARVAYNTGNGFVESPLSSTDNVAVLAPKYAPVVMDYDHDGSDDLLEPIDDPHPWRVRHFKNGEATWENITFSSGPGTMGDFDGDGNPDLLTGSKTYSPGEFRLARGRGKHDHLLHTITDGMGRMVSVEYDGNPSTANPDDPHSLIIDIASAQSRWQGGWPVQIVHPGKTTHAVVTTHIESHYTTQARSADASQVDRHFDYNYGNWANDVAGLGPLGFESRLIVEQDGQGVERSRRLIDFDVQQPDTSSTPYVRPLTGLPVKITELGAAVDETTTTYGYIPRTETTFDWEPWSSDVAMPFAYLREKITQTGFDITSSELATPDYLEVLAEWDEVSQVDQYNNVTHQDISGADFPHTTIDWDFTPTAGDESDWLISLAHSHDAVSVPANCTDNCDNLTRHRHEVFTYYPHTGSLETIERAPGVPELDQLTTLGRTPNGNVNQVVTSDSSNDKREVDIGFDDRYLFPTSVVRVGGGSSQTTQVSYDDRYGAVGVRVDPNGIDQTWSYDDLGKLRLFHGPDGDGSIDYASDDAYSIPELSVLVAANYQVKTAKSGGEISVNEYNALGQLVRSEVTGLNGKDVSEERDYDQRNRLNRVFRPHLDGDSSQGNEQYFYDALDRVTQVQQPRSPTSTGSGPISATYFYGLMDRVKSGFNMDYFSSTRVVDPSGRVITKGFSAIGKLLIAFDSEGTDPVQVDIPLGTQYAYGAFNDLVDISFMTEGDADPLQLTRDDYGRITQRSAPFSGKQVASISYNGLDEPVDTFDNAGRERGLVYDDYGRLDHTYDLDGAFGDGYTKWVYDTDLSGKGGDTIGRLVQTISPTHQIVSYDYTGPEAGGINRGLLANVTESLSAPSGTEEVDLSVDYTYDAASRLTQVDYPSVAGARFSVQYCYDRTGHLIEARAPGDPDCNDQATVSYWKFLDDDQGLRIKSERLGDTACNQSGVVTTRQFDVSTGQLDDIQSACGDNVVQHLSYQYSDSGQTIGRADGLANRDETFDYDSAGRIQGINGQVAFRYMSNNYGLGFQAGVGVYGSQPGGPTQAPNAYWTYTAGNDNVYLHDAAGDQTARSGSGVQGGSQSIAYTMFDLPNHIDQGSSYAVDFRYDASGTRTIKAASTSGSPGDVTFYLGDLFQRVEHSSGAATNRNMIYAGGRLIAIAATTDADPTHPTVHYLHDDALGSIQTITGENGAVEATRDFGAFGVERGGQALFDVVPYGFTGQEQDADLGLINMHGRIYDPVLGQFLSPDPAMDNPMGHGLNAFAYVGNQPLDFVDPSGFFKMGVNGEYEFDDDPLFGFAPRGSVSMGFTPTPVGSAPGSLIPESTANVAAESTLGAVADEGGDFLASLGPMAEAAAKVAPSVIDIFLTKPNQHSSHGVVQNRGPQAAASNQNKTPPADSTRPPNLDQGCSTWHPPCSDPPATPSGADPDPIVPQAPDALPFGPGGGDLDMSEPESGGCCSQFSNCHCRHPGMGLPGQDEAGRGIDNMLMKGAEGDGEGPGRSKAKPSPKFKPPTNPPQLPPSYIPEGTRIFRGRPTEQYPNGYWKIEKFDGQGWQRLDPRTMKPGPHPDTHVPFPSGYTGPFDN